tara:strand:- start:299 stop:475 length:177 start_codon:yes stop_codon:yes gene_type:complete
MPVVTVNTSGIDENLNKLSSPFDYFRLMKPRVMSLVVFTAFVGYTRQNLLKVMTYILF